MPGFTDIHSHFVYGMDDGARTQEAMERMLDAAHANGIATLFATPHVTPALRPFAWEDYKRHLDMARAYCEIREYGMTLYAGAELLYTPAMAQHIAEHRLPTLAGSDYVLVEFVPDISFKELEDAVIQMERAGYTPILAHIERYETLLRGKNAWELKKRHRVCYQVNADAVVTPNSFFKERKIRSWFGDELIDFVASDAHGCKRRPYQMQEAYETLKQRVPEAYARRLTAAQIAQSQ